MIVRKAEVESFRLLIDWENASPAVIVESCRRYMANIPPADLSSEVE